MFVPDWAGSEYEEDLPQLPPKECRKKRRLAVPDRWADLEDGEDTDMCNYMEKEKEQNKNASGLPVQGGTSQHAFGHPGASSPHWVQFSSAHLTGRGGRWQRQLTSSHARLAGAG